MSPQSNERKTMTTEIKGRTIFETSYVKVSTTNYNQNKCPKGTSWFALYVSDDPLVTSQFPFYASEKECFKLCQKIKQLDISQLQNLETKLRRSRQQDVNSFLFIQELVASVLQFSNNRSAS